MNLRTSNEFQDHLDKEIAWRIREIHQLKKSVDEHKQLAKVALIRAGVPLVYAHWEGFVKSGSEALLNFVANQRKKYKELEPCFALHGLGASLELLGNSKKSKRRVEALKFIMSSLDEVAHFSSKDKINTRANLSSEVFESIAAAIGLDTARYSARYTMIDEQLLKARNRIAHGERMILTGAAFGSLADETIVLLRWVKTDLENSVAQGSYLATAS